MADKPSLLWHSNAPFTNTGYGQQTALFTRRLKDHYRLVISAFHGLEGASISWEEISILPGIGNTFGNECLPEHANVVFGSPRDGLVVTLMDVWVLEPSIWRQFNVASWVPVDHEPAPDPVRRFFTDSGAVPIAMSRFGQEQLADLAPLYCPHAVDTEVYKPRHGVRKGLGLPEDAFIVGMVAANKGNPSRKCFVEAFQAFQVLHGRHPEARLYLHTEMSGRFGGLNLPKLLTDTGIPLSAAFFCDQYRAVHLPFPQEKMAQVYSAMDVLLAPSAGEGFGIPVIEAQACGVPVIVSDFSAQPELVGAGWKVSGTRTYTPIGSWQFSPDVEDIADALEQAWTMATAERKRAATQAREFSLAYDIDRVFAQHMLPALQEAQQRFDARKPMALRELAAA